jgi:hypothetical protein
MPRYEDARLSAKALGLHVGDPLAEPTPLSRSYDDPVKLQNLYAIGISLQQWALRLDTYSLKALAASSLDADSLKSTLSQVAAVLAENAPVAVSPSSLIPHSDAAREIDHAVFLANELPGYVDDNFNFTWQPVGPFPNGVVPPDAPYECEWLPPERSTSEVVLSRLTLPLKDARRTVAWNEFGGFARRTAGIATAAARRLMEHLESDAAGGFALGDVERSMASLEAASADRRVHGEFMAAVHGLASLNDRTDPGQWAEWAAFSERLLAIYGDWISGCYGPLLSGDKARSTRQSKKNVLRRLVSVVSQYGTLMRGAEGMPRLAAAIHCLDFIGQQLQTRVKKLHPPVSEPSPNEVQRQLRLWDESLVTRDTRDRWGRVLAGSSEACGRIARFITLSASSQEEPWVPGEHIEQLVEAGVFGRKNPDKEFTEIRIRMQEAGIAAQGPWDFIEGKASTPETKSGVADKWLINPLAEVLAPTSI